ncbi:FAD-dependent oxidoreductase [Simkania negevensis]|uniref:FAD-dependent oxidoreductase n=1 Tax=Simkania negevensis TaxID=83561 RepID=A0ABS3ASR1_9BACT|nr:FAD-dependent oxidoreductase [Simkania negevensis]
MIVLGGGIIGLTIAWQLVQSGAAKVRAVIESDEYPAATLSAAGMLAPITEGFFSNMKLMDIGIRSLGLYDDFLAQLRKETEKVPELSSEGTLLVAEDHDGLEWLRNRFQILQKMESDCHWLCSSELQEREPFIGSSALAAVHIPMERQIHVSQLSAALRTALDRHNVEIVRKKVIRVEDTTSWILHFSDHSHMECERLVIACGAWLDSLQMGREVDKPTVIPNQGQLVVARLSKDLSLRHMIRTRKVYICPRNDGTVRLGASSEFIGYDTNPTIGNIREIFRDTWKLLPALSDAHFIAAHAGLRPCSNTEMPVVKQGDKEGLYWAVGHGRSGVLLAPWTGKRLEKILR